MIDEIEPAMTVKEICKAIGRSPATVSRMLKAGDIPCQRGTHGGPIVPRALFRKYLSGEWTKPEPAASKPVDFIQRRQTDNVKRTSETG